MVARPRACPTKGLQQSVALFLGLLLGCSESTAPDEARDLDPTSHPIRVFASIEYETDHEWVRLWVNIAAKNVSNSVFHWGGNGHCHLGFELFDHNGTQIPVGRDCQQEPTTLTFEPGQNHRFRDRWDGDAPSGAYYLLAGLWHDSEGVSFADTVYFDWVRP